MRAPPYARVLVRPQKKHVFIRKNQSSPSSQSVVSMSAFTIKNIIKPTNTLTPSPQVDAPDTKPVMNSSPKSDKAVHGHSGTRHKGIIQITPSQSSTHTSGFVISFDHKNEKIQVFVPNVDVPKDVSISFHSI